jgi:hypothetical protein
MQDERTWKGALAGLLVMVAVGINCSSTAGESPHGGTGGSAVGGRTGTAGADGLGGTGLGGARGDGGRDGASGDADGSGGSDAASDDGRRDGPAGDADGSGGAGFGGSGGIDGGDAGTFRCGRFFCPLGSSYCGHSLTGGGVGGSVPDAASPPPTDDSRCVTVPSRCASTPTCDCLCPGECFGASCRCSGSLPDLSCIGS